MSYAVRNDQLGFRCVDGPGDVAKGEFFSETMPSLPIPGTTRQEIEKLRLYAYSDPVTGSDRFIAEAASERLDGNEDMAIAAEERHRIRRAEIAEQFPWP